VPAAHSVMRQEESDEPCSWSCRRRRVVRGLWRYSCVPVLDRARTSDTGKGRFTFALIGDMPYGPEGELKSGSNLREHVVWPHAGGGWALDRA
jgi:hypothetical protein